MRCIATVPAATHRDRPCALRRYIVIRFNTYDAFIQLYGPDAPERLRAEIARYEQLYRVELNKFPMSRHAELRALCVRRYRARTRTFPLPRVQHTTADRLQPRGNA